MARRASRRRVPRVERDHHPEEPGLQGTAVQIAQDERLLRAGYTFDADEANRICDFFRLHLRHSKAEWAGQPLELAPWQARWFRRLFGWKRPDGTRRYTESFGEIPRKNGKSTLAAGIATYMTTADGEASAEVYCAASDREQAEIVFDEAKRMIESSPTLSQLCEVFRGSIFVQESMSRLKPLSARPKHGFNPSCAIIDELHEFRDRRLWDAVTTGFGARRQPLTFTITTAGDDINSLGHQQHEYALQVINGVIEAPHYLPVVYAAADTDDWTSPKTWAKANPNLGIGVKESWLAQQCLRAEADTGAREAFLRFNLNIWLHGVNKWLNVKDWDACGRQAFDLDELKGRPCYGGLDLSKTTDLTALVLVFPRDEGGYDVVPYFWVPSESADQRARRDRVPYPDWISQGLIRATPGNVVDYDFIEKHIADITKTFDVREIAYDRAFATQLVQRLQDTHNVTMVEFGQGFMSMAAPTAELERLVVSRRLRHDRHPVLRWNASNVVVSTDPAGNMKPDKKKSTERIDGIVALIMALGRATLGKDATSVYETQGLTVV